MSETQAWQWRRAALPGTAVYFFPGITQVCQADSWSARADLPKYLFWQAKRPGGALNADYEPTHIIVRLMRAAGQPYLCPVKQPHERRA
jgi:hypothetical protein